MIQALLFVSGLCACSAQACVNGAADAISERKTGEHRGSEDLFVTGDFDGNGRMDRGYFARTISETGRRVSLCVSMNEGEQEIELLVLRGEPRNVGIRTASPGTYVAACVKGYGKGCRPDALRAVELDVEAILFFMYESGSRIYYWRNNRFHVMYLSD